ncbi:ISH3 family transposase [Saccharolobus shibatae]|uniref:Transposase IS4-like domain-containing protein n=1 Tax=Saccharolobus shibatae TaxID=2286 RepID=A0A8F5GVS2_9CREN|nr:ISH3 family transposase [Saccharolobus shibatae]QXJ31246.1 hypothetical protein J5U21_00896 [Saccharolobus shibatae]
MGHKNQTKRTKPYNRDFVRSALKLIYTFLTNILFPEELLKALLKARGTYLSRLGNEGRRALKLLNNIDVDDVRKALREMGKKVLRETRDRRVAIDFHSQPQYHKDKSLLSRIKPNKGTSWGLVQVAIFLLSRKSIFLDVLPITVKNIAEDFKMVMQVVLEELDKFDLRLVRVYGDREFAVNEVVKFLLDLGVDFVIAARYQMYRKYEDKLRDVDITYCGVRYTGFLCVRHVSGAYLVILRKEVGKKGDGIIAFLVSGEVDVRTAVVLAEERWGVENAFRSLEEFRVRTRTCDVRKELVLILLCYFLLNIWFLVRSWRRVRLWEFSQALVDFLVLKEMREVVAQGLPQVGELFFANLS